jgi:hypothetical protein
LTNFTNYKYEIISHPAKPELIGEFLTIDIPYFTEPWIVERQVFNNEFSDVAPTIGSETFTHEVGKPWTYPNSSQLDEIAPTRWYNVSAAQTVGQGTADTSTTIEIEHQITTEESRTYTTETSHDVEGTVLFATAGGGWHSAKVDTRFTEVTIGTTRVYEGAVGQIQDSDTWRELKFTFGLFVYQLERPEGIAYQVVNYYVNGAPVYDAFLSESPETLSTVIEFPGLGLATGGVLLLIPYLLRKRRGKNQ